MATTVDIHDLVKNYGKTRALDGLNLRVTRGEVHGFLGPNGSGKTTTIRVLLGLLRASGGDARLFGQDPWKHAVELHKRLAYVPGDVHLWPSLTGGQAIDVLGRMRGGLERKRVDAMLERFALDPTKKSRTYSKGNRQKVALVAALASTAELLILDEPTSGLDPLMETIFQDCISEAKTDGRTVLLSSHILAEVEALCDRVSIIRRGKTVQSGSLEELRHLTRTSVSASTKRTVTGIADKPGVHNYVADGRHVRFDVEGQHLDETMSALATFGIHSLTSQPPTLEELFLRQYGEDLPAADREATETSRERRQ